MSRWRRDDGMTTSQVAILFPIFLFWLMLIVQYGLWWHAKQVANAAASEATDAAKIQTATSNDGSAAAQDYLDQSGNLSNITIEVDRLPATVTVEIRGDAPQLVPGIAWSVIARSEAPVERFVPEPER